MKKIALLVLGMTLFTAAQAAEVSMDENLYSVDLCIDNSSFTANIGGLGTTSTKVAQGVYDYFVSNAKTKSVKFTENGDKACAVYAVNMTFIATTGNPRAWAAQIWVADGGAYASLETKYRYPKPVTVWNDYTVGVLENNDGIAAYLTGEGQKLVDNLFAAYKTANK